MNPALIPRSTFSESFKYSILVRQSFRCRGIPAYRCPLEGRHFDEAGYDIDHIVPLSKGGSNDPTNLQALCPSCHRVKTAGEHKTASKRLTEDKEAQHLIRAFMVASGWTLEQIATMSFPFFWNEFEVWCRTTGVFRKKHIIQKNLGRMMLS